MNEATTTLTRTELQRYHFARPMPAGQLPSWVSRFECGAVEAR